MGTPGLELCTNNLSIFALGQRKCLPGDDVMIYDHVDMVGFLYCFFVAYFRNFIISPILNSISKNEVDWFEVEVLFLYLYTDWYHMTVGICRPAIVS